MELATIKKIDLRKAWKQEDVDFTTWLAQEENLRLLSEEIGINIKLKQTEASVGSFSVDILAEEETSGRNIIIENQLETTNHTHLGQIITYASGFDAEFIIWIVKDVRDEHKQAIDWLNEHTDEKINFFAIKMELWQIGDSPFAPKFQIISQPNDWAKAIKATKSGELSESALQQLEFLDNFIKYSKEKGTSLRLGKPQPSAPAYYSIGIGSSGAWIAIKLNVSQRILKIDLYTTEKKLFYELQKSKTEIEKDFGKKLNWDEMPQYKGAIIGDQIEFNIEDKEKWDKYFEWLKSNAEIFQKVFSRYIKRIKV